MTAPTEVTDLTARCRVPLCDWCDRGRDWCLCQPAWDPVEWRRARRRVDARHAAAVARAHAADTGHTTGRTAA